MTEVEIIKKALYKNFSKEIYELKRIDFTFNPCTEHLIQRLLERRIDYVSFVLELSYKIKSKMAEIIFYSSILDNFDTIAVGVSTNYGMAILRINKDTKIITIVTVVKENKAYLNYKI